MVVAREPKLYDLLINIPPATTKTTIATIMFPAWLWAIDPTIRILSNSYSDSLALDHSLKTKDIVTSDLFISMFPDTVLRGDKKAKSGYGTTKNGTRDTTSTGATATGRHAHVITNDDPQNPAQAESDAMRKQAIMQGRTLSNRKIDPDVSVTINIMQRLHTEDWSGELLKNPSGIRHIRLPATLLDKIPPLPADAVYEGRTLKEWYERGGGYLDPVRLGPRHLEDQLSQWGSRGYAGQYNQSPTVEQGDIVKKEWLQIISYSDYHRRKLERSHIHFFVDTAFTNKRENDPTGIIAVDKVGNDIYILNAAKVWKTFPDLIRWLPDWVRSNGYTDESSIRIEPKANGLSVIQQLRELTRLNVTQTPAPSDDKKARLHAVSPKVEGGRVYLIEGSWNESFIEEVAGFPNMPHDEYVDLLVYAIAHFLTDTIEVGEYENILW